MKKLLDIINKKQRLVVGLMSGTSVDGIDAALVRIKGKGINSKVELLEFENFSFDDDIREKIFNLFNIQSCKIDYLCHMNFVLGELFAQAALRVIDKARISKEDVDLIGSHGQTVYHMPTPILENGYKIKSTLQIGEPSVIAQRTGIITVGDFRVGDMAVGGDGAPLVPYTEYILYRKKDKCIGLQNIGGISNITVIPKNSTVNNVYAFDNAPGNMVIDEVVKRITNGEKRFDESGIMAQKGKVNDELLNILMKDEYFSLEPPKTTGREYFGCTFVDKLIYLAAKLNIKDIDIVSTTTALTAKAISESYKQFILPYDNLDQVIIGGGGSYNKTLVNMISQYLPKIQIVTQEDIGFNSDAKEAVAFAILANETINGNCNNIPKATGAQKGAVLGKIII